MTSYIMKCYRDHVNIIDMKVKRMLVHGVRISLAR